MKSSEAGAATPDGAVGAGRAEKARAAPRSRLLRTAKRGESTSDDAGCTSDEEGRYALCDGASRSSLAGTWAEILARQVCNAGLPPTSAELRAWLAPARAEWEARRSATAAKNPTWYNRIVRPGAATLFALEIEGARGDGDRTFTAVMRGDTCGFHVRDGHLVGEAMPCRKSSEISSNPACLMSMVEGSSEADLRVERGTARAGDVFFIATDALAKWILVEAEEGRSPWRRLLELDAPERFQAFADEERESRRMDEDDVSLLVVEIVAMGNGSAERGGVSTNPRERSSNPRDGSTAAPSSRHVPGKAHHTNRRRRRDRLVWSVLVPLVVAVLSSTATTLLLARMLPGWLVAPLPWPGTGAIATVAPTEPATAAPKVPPGQP